MLITSTEIISRSAEDGALPPRDKLLLRCLLAQVFTACLEPILDRLADRTAFAGVGVDAYSPLIVAASLRGPARPARADHVDSAVVTCQRQARIACRDM